MAKYLLQCECGESHVISNHQAGSTLACGCGKELIVPTLRNLADLPRVDEADTKPKSSWGIRQGVFTAGLLVALTLGSICGWFQFRMPAPPKPFDLAARSEFFKENVDQLTPVESWTLWMVDLKPLAELGTRKVESPVDMVRKNQIKRFTYYRNVFGIAAAAVLGISLLVTLMLPSSQPR